MLDLEVQPERSLGNQIWEFVLGMPLYQAVQVLRSQDTVVKGVQLCYNEQNPLDNDLVISLTQDGIRLIFDADSQTLKVIEIFNMNRVKLKYCDVYFNTPLISPTIAQIDRSFGATHPGVYISEKQLLLLNFRGLSFEFKIDPKLEPIYLHGIGSLRFPTGMEPVVARLFIYSGHTREAAISPSMPLCCYHGSCYLEKLDVLRDHGQLTTGIKLHLGVEGTGASRISQSKKVSLTRTVNFGDSCQDVLTALGAPNKIFYKDQDKMKIHSSVSAKASNIQQTDFFFNYFTLGLDILFDAVSRRVKKFVLHTNFPGHYNFNIYYRCKFHIPVVTSKQREAGENVHHTASAALDQAVDLQYNTKWNTVRDLMLSPGTKPVVLNRANATNNTNPFGSTFCYGFQDLIFEVMTNQHIASVTLYHRPTRIASAVDNRS